ncbi:MAG: PBECR4 domain-containing protein [Eubacteriales bacterium]
MTVDTKKDIIRNNIINSVQVYKNKLAGKYYLYIFENQYFEMYFGTDNFLHLTGVKTALTPNQFYQLAKNGHLQKAQMSFEPRFPLNTALKKTNGLQNLDNFINEDCFVIKDFITDTETYPFVLTNIDQSILIGLKAEEIEVMYIPKSFRIKGNVFDKTTNDKLFEVDYILSKTDKQAKYNTVLYSCDKKIKIENPEILSKISENVLLSEA